ncbi:MAG: 30S ribosomal protein S8 [Clostridia bacterium]|nr:30S ribosomal protein S8 [Clostridia bacterium]
MTDPIADMLTRIRNAMMVNKETVEIPSSNMKKAIADIMLKEGYVSDVKLVEDGYNGKLVITLKYIGKNKPVINALKRASKPGLRLYTDVENMPRVMNGMGIAILSTNKGVMTNKQAKAENVGGEVLCYIW